MEIYLVGGAVRDELLGLPVVERDWVVIGADAQAMRAQGFVPVDSVFPVFRHPESGEEYALARRETKVGEGYRGFEVDAGPDVTLDEDLCRRDLTINAIARDADGRLIDPFGGCEDLDQGLLRHVSPAFTEDPLRVLRVARFAAKLGRFGFRVAHATQHLMVDMVRRGDMAHLHAERVWRETVKALACDQPWRYFEVLQGCGALAELLPEVAACLDDDGGIAHQQRQDARPIRVLRQISTSSDDPAVRFAAFIAACPTAVTGVGDLLARLRCGRDVQQLVRRTVQGLDAAGHAVQGDLDSLLLLATTWRALDPDTDLERIARLYAALLAPQPAGEVIRIGLRAARGVSAGPLRDQGLAGGRLGEALRAARRDAMRNALAQANLLP